MGITGGCYCGKIRYEVNGLQEGAFQCHCRECQYIKAAIQILLSSMLTVILYIQKALLRPFHVQI